MANKIILGVISVLVVVTLLGSVLMPVIQDNEGGYMAEKRITLNNEGTPLIKGDPSADYTITWDSALPGTIKVNGNVVTVYFVAGDDATLDSDSKTVVQDLTYGELPVPTRTGYTFDGWYTSTAYTTEVTADTIVSGSNDKILYAKWVGNEYTVTFDADGGTVSPETKTVVFGSAYGELPVPTYTGHIFGGWFDENNEPVTAESIVNIADDHTLTAVWTLEQYLVSFTTDGNGTVSTDSLLVDYGTTYTISSNTIVIGLTTVTATADLGYVFDYWTPGTSGTITAATTFIANFNNPPVTITFAADSPGSVSSNSIADVPIGTQYVVADNVVTITGFTPVTAALVDGYYFTGWNIAQGVGTIAGAMTFTAQYEMIEIADVVCSDETTWVVTTDGKLFGCGANNRYQQGDGTTTNVTTFTQRLDTETVASVSCSDGTTWAITTDGKLFGCGYNYNGQQGSGDTTNVTTFTQRLDTETVASVSCSVNQTWAITDDGKIFGCGSSNKGQQGNGATTNVTTFTQRLDTETIEKIKTKGSVSWALTTDGKLFGCGYNGSGQQGNNSTSDVSTFTQRLTTETIVKYACTGQLTWAITDDGKLFGCGYNNNGQQGSGDTVNVKVFAQRGPAGAINIAPVIPLTPIITPINPGIIINPIIPLSTVTAADIVGTDYTFLAGGEDWLLCSVSLGVDTYGIALYYAGLSEPLVWDTDMEFEFSNGSLSVTNGGQSYTMQYDSIYFLGNGDYLLMTSPAYIFEDTEILGYALPAADSGIMVKGTANALESLSIADGSITSLGSVAAATDGTDYDDVVLLDSITAEYDSDSADCSSIIVPKKTVVTITVEDHTIDNLVGVIPVIIIAALMLAAAGIFVFRRAE